MLPLLALLPLALSDDVWYGDGASLLQHTYSLAGAAVGASLIELVIASLIIRACHRISRSALGRLYGMSYDVFTAIDGVQAMALQRTLVGEKPCPAFKK
jgi:hypothetical protein